MDPDKAKIDLCIVAVVSFTWKSNYLICGMPDPARVVIIVNSVEFELREN